MLCTVDMRIGNKTKLSINSLFTYIQLCLTAGSMYSERKSAVSYIFFPNLLYLVFHILCISTQSFSKEVNTCLHAAEGTPLIKRSWGVLGH